MPEREPSSAGIDQEVLEIRRLLAREELDGARRRLDTLLQSAPLEPRSWLLAAQLALRLRQSTAAIAYLRRALACGSREPAILIELAQLFLRLGKRREALAASCLTADLPPSRPEHFDAVGTLLTHVGEPVRGIAMFGRAVAAVPGNAGFLYNLAMAQRMVGDFSASERKLDVVISLRPEDGEAQYARSVLRKQTPEHNHVAELERIVAQRPNTPGSTAAEFALAKELEDIGEHARSYAHLQAACFRHRARRQYNVAEDVAVLDDLRHAHTAAALERLTSGFHSEECIFIVGLPRSGTTLVERILSAHELVYGAGELDAFPSEVIEAVNKRVGAPVGKREFVLRALDVDFECLGRAYVEETRPRTGRTPKFTDKLPSNYLYAGLIRAALPRAKFILVRRHPMDNCYAMYKTLFASAYPFSYDLQDLARYYVAWDQLMRHWQSVLGTAWLEVHYEDLIANQEGVSRELIAHCGLQWDRRCLQFHASAEAVTTASDTQVRQPLYADSVGKWRAYEAQLAGLARELTARGIDCA
jgi:tetratricopeptide (TPR) repeat protein